MSSADSIRLTPLEASLPVDKKTFAPKHFDLLSCVPNIQKQIQESVCQPSRSCTRRWLSFVTAILTTIFVIICGIFGNIFQLLTIPLMFYDRTMVLRWHSYLAGSIWSILQHLFEKQSGVKITISGLENIPSHENAYIISNHVCFADFAVVHAIAIRRKMLSFCKYFVKDSVKYIPIFGWGMKIMGMVMLRRNWAQDRAKFQELFELFTGGRLPVYLISYPEGSRVTPAKLLKSQVFSSENKLPVLDNLLCPRSKGFLATMIGLRGSDVNHLYDITVVYYNERMGLHKTWSVSQMFTGQLDGYHLHIHVDRIPFDSMPKAEDELKAWIFTRFKIKDSLVTAIGKIYRGIYEAKQV